LLKEKNKVKSAVILAAGVPKSKFNKPDCLYEINGEAVIENTIKHLQDRNIYDIYIVVGYKKEMFSYLEHEFNVKLLLNKDYAKTGTSKSFLIAINEISNSYIIPGDLYFEENPFNNYELFSWYGKELGQDSELPFSSYRLKSRDFYANFDSFIGLAYLEQSEAASLKKKTLLNYAATKIDYSTHWESFIFASYIEKDIYIRSFKNSQFIEVSKITPDIKNEHFGSKATIVDIHKLIAQTLDTDVSQIKDLSQIKSGMTNYSFTFDIDKSKYVIRIPKPPSKKIINRTEETTIYEAIKFLKYTEDVVYVSSDSGVKISKFIENSRIINPWDLNDLRVYSTALRLFHEEKLSVSHHFDLFNKISEFERLVDLSITFNDYQNHRDNVLLLARKILPEKAEKVLCHIDSNFENYLLKDSTLFFIDFEYSSMADPLLDLAMFSIYAGYDKLMVDKLVEMYLEETPTKSILIVVYTYISLAGILWANWCGYYNDFGYEFDDYWLNQYKSSKLYYSLAINELEVNKGIKK
jgi:thiamine kinase-like enzyme/CTP:phosphocholine cytidylyltransferase-like protein